MSWLHHIFGSDHTTSQLFRGSNSSTANDEEKMGTEMGTERHSISTEIGSLRKEASLAVRGLVLMADDLEDLDAKPKNRNAWWQSMF
jgi:predicted dithiol-disulfide oxidoreductase (DUF899 family)